jgi:Rod binding domain-containing protein
MGNADSAADFARRLGKFQRESDGEGDPARNTAKELIAQGFILPMLKMARESEFKTGMFHGGQGEKAFGAQLDERLARRVAEQVAPGLVDAVYRKVHNNGGAGATGDGAPAQTQPGREVDRHG